MEKNETKTTTPLSYVKALMLALTMLVGAKEANANAPLQQPPTPNDTIPVIDTGKYSTPDSRLESELTSRDINVLENKSAQSPEGDDRIEKLVLEHQDVSVTVYTRKVNNWLMMTVRDNNTGEGFVLGIMDGEYRITDYMIIHIISLYLHGEENLFQIMHRIMSFLYTNNHFSLSAKSSQIGESTELCEFLLKKYANENMDDNKEKTYIQLLIEWLENSIKDIEAATGNKRTKAEEKTLEAYKKALAILTGEIETPEGQAVVISEVGIGMVIIKIKGELVVLPLLEE